MKRIISILTVLFFISTYILGVNNDPKAIDIYVKNITPLSAEASKMAKFTDFPVNYSKGLVNISIPLYEIKSGELTLPIYLSYDHSGLKPQQPNGRVGTGWTLHAEPSIMRFINGLPDESSSENQKGYLNTEKTNREYKDLFENKCDLEPDEFHYTTLSGGGIFYTNKEGGSSSYPNKEDVINYNNLSPIIIDKNGIIHNYDIREQTKKRITTCWKCSSIKSPGSDETITFEYQQKDNVISLVSNKSNYVTIDDANNATGGGVVTMQKYTNGSSTNQYLPPNNTQSTDPEFYFNFIETKDKLDKKQRLSKINFDNGTITFEYKNNSLSKIHVYDKQNNEIRTISFIIKKYNNTTNLKKLVEIYIDTPQDNTETLHYKFSYFQENRVPMINTNSIDHWGFYNGANNQGTVPKGIVSYKQKYSDYTTLNQQIGNANRESSAYYSKFGVLEKIQNPYGIETTFIYKGNRAFKDVEGESNLKNIGGLRISEIINKDSQNKITKRRTFKYCYSDNPELGSESLISENNAGVARKLVNIDDYCSSQVRKFYVRNNTETISRLRTWGSYPLSQISFFNGTNVFYNNVIETIYGTYNNYVDNSEKITKKYYYATPRKSEYIGFKRSINIPFSIKRELDIRERGLPVCIETYRNDRLVLREKYEYDDVLDTDPDTKKGIFILKPYQKTVTTSNDQNMEWTIENNKEFDGKEVNIESRWSILKKKITEKYTQNNKKIITEKNYSYQTEYPIFHKEPKKIEEKLSNGKSKIVKYIYPTDNEAKQFDESFGVEQLKSLNKYSLPIQIKETIGSTSKYKQIKYNSIGLPKTIQTRLGNNGNFIEELNCTYTSGKYREIKEKDGIVTTYLWGYNKQYPIAKIRNATYTEIANAITIPNESNYKPTTEEIKRINSLRKKLKHTEVTTYTYLPLIGTLTSITDPKGFTTYFENDNYGRLLKSYIKSNNTNLTIEDIKYNLGAKKEPDEPDEPSITPIESIEMLNHDKKHMYNNDDSYDVNGWMDYPGGSGLKCAYSMPYEQKNNLEILVSGGSGDYTYNWTIRYYKDMIDFRKNKEPVGTINFHTKKITFITKEYKGYKVIKIECNVYDNQENTQNVFNNTKMLLILNN